MNTKLAKEFYAKKTPNGGVLFKQVAPNKKWSENKIIEVANLCESKVECKNKYPGAVHASKLLGIYKRVCAHMVKPIIHNKKWTLQTILDVASNYNYYFDFTKKERSGAYGAAKNLKLLPQIKEYFNSKNILSEQ